MAKPVLTQEIAYTALQDFFANNKPFVLFGTGTSCTIDRNFGMESLLNQLSAAIPKLTVDPIILAEWKNVEKNLSATKDFESAMNAIKHESLVQLIVQETYKHISAVDQKACLELLGKRKSWSAIYLLKKLVDNLPPGDPVLHIATPNYDMVAEYAFTSSTIPYITGFWGGVVRQMDWTQSERAMTYPEKTRGRRKPQMTTRTKSHIRLYKVHGSLNTFIINEEIVECDIWREKTPDFVKPMMITPGASKHERLHDHRSVLLNEFDKAVSEHNAFLFLGFGFNDSQLVNNKIIPKLKAQAVPALIITRDLNRNIEVLLKKSDNFWIVCKHEDIANESTKIYNSKFKNWLYVDNKQLWNFDIFTTEILGG